MTATLATTLDTDDQGIPLDIEPLLSPYLQQGQLSIRIERLPPRARLSKGRNNGDNTFSLKPDDVHDLVYIPPAEAVGSPVELAVRVVKLDGDYATTLALIDLPLGSASTSEAGGKRNICFAETPERSKGEAIELPARLQPVEKEEADRTLSMAPAEAHVELQKLRRAFNVLSHTLAETEARAADAEKMAEEAVARNADSTTLAEDADAAAERVRADLKQEHEAELARLRQQLEAATADLEAAHKQAVDAADSAHAQEVAELQNAHARDLETQIAALKAQLEQEPAERLAAAQREAGEQAETALAAVRETWQAEETERLAAAREKHERELLQLRQQQDTAFADTEQAHKQALEAAEKTHAQEIAELQSTHARDLETQISATTKQLELEAADRLAEAQREAGEQAEAQLKEARQTWDAEAEVALAAAHQAWQAEETQRLAAANEKYEQELLQLRQQRDAATGDVEAANKQTLQAAETAHAQTIAELQDSHVRALEEQIAETKKELEARFAGHLSDVLHEAGEKAEAGLAAARESWQAEEAERMAAASEKYEQEIANLRQQRDAALGDSDEAHVQALETAEASHAQATTELQDNHARALEEQAAATKTELESEFADRLADALREAGEKAATTLSAARETWKTEETERLAAANEGSQTEISDLRQQLEAVTVEIEELRRQAADAVEPADAEGTGEPETKTASADIVPGSDFEHRLAEALRQAEEQAEERLTEERKVWETSAQNVLNTAREKWKVAEEERLAAAMRAWEKGIRKPGRGPRTRRFSGRFDFYTWMPRRSLLVTAAIVCLFALPPLHPDIKAIILEYSRPAVTELRSRIEPLLKPQPVVVQPPQLHEPVAAPAVVELRALVKVERANVRAGPSTATAVVRSLGLGSTVTLLETQNEWSRVRFGAGADDVGWVHDDLLNEPF